MTARAGGAPNHPTKGSDMSGNGKKNELPAKDEGKSRKSPPVTAEDDDVEDGDIATPKRDRYGDDDKPL
jgi:hypothetical protein